MLDEPIRVSAGPDGVRVVPTRLFPNSLKYTAPSPDVLGLGATAFLLDEIGGLGQRALGQIDVLEQGTDWSLFYAGQPMDVWKGAARLLISVGNTSAMLMAACSEIAGLIDYSQEPGQFPNISDPALHRAAFLLEASEQYAVSIGHQLTAAAFRVCATDAQTLALLRTETGTRRSVDACLQGVDKRDAWPFHSASIAAARPLRSSRSGAARCLLATARLYGSPSWKRMVANRDQWFHQFRPDFLLRANDSMALTARRKDTLFHALRRAAKPLRGFALGLDIASPVQSGAGGIRLFARDTILEEGANGDLVPVGLGIDRIRAIVT